MIKTCCITGTSGYLGGCLVRYFFQHGWKVIELNRSGMVRAGGAEARRYELGDAFPTDLREVGALVHAAYDLKAVSWKEILAKNVEGTARLFESARQAGVDRLVNISSMSAYQGCRSLYGKAKLISESNAAQYGGISFRPGLIYDENRPGGMLGKLRALSTLAPVVPLPGNGRNVLYFTHQDDLSRFCEEYCSGKSYGPQSVITTANPTPWMFMNIIKELAKKQRRLLYCLPTPWQLSWAALKGLEMAGINPPFKSDSLISLLNQDTSPKFNDNITQFFRPFY
jgi:nucleoside-diphosphate-sugar epimerase